MSLKGVSIKLLKEKKNWSAQEKKNGKKSVKELYFMLTHVYAQIRIILPSLLIAINWITATNWNENYLFYNRFQAFMWPDTM